MKIIRYNATSGPAYGILEGRTIYAATGNPFTGNLTKGDRAGRMYDTPILPPVEPSKIIAVGLNYALHVAEGDPNREVPTEPVLFMKPPSALIGYGVTIKLPPGERIDHEAELAIVIGTRAYRVREDQAHEYILGYTCANDVSHRDQQQKDGQWIRAKGYDTFLPLGPVIDTDVDGGDLAIQGKVNGEVRQSSRTSNMIFSPTFLVSYISNVMTLLPGDVILTGTPEGVGPLKPGDTVEVEIEGIGTLENVCARRFENE